MEKVSVKVSESECGICENESPLALKSIVDEHQFDLYPYKSVCLINEEKLIYTYNDKIYLKNVITDKTIWSGELKKFIYKIFRFPEIQDFIFGVSNQDQVTIFQIEQNQLKEIQFLDLKAPWLPISNMDYFVTEDGKSKIIIFARTAKLFDFDTSKGLINEIAVNFQCKNAKFLKEINAIAGFDNSEDGKIMFLNKDLKEEKIIELPQFKIEGEQQDVAWLHYEGTQYVEFSAFESYQQDSHYKIAWIPNIRVVIFQIGEKKIQGWKVNEDKTCENNFVYTSSYIDDITPIGKNHLLMRDSSQIVVLNLLDRKPRKLLDIPSNMGLRCNLEMNKFIILISKEGKSYYQIFASTSAQSKITI